MIGKRLCKNPKETQQKHIRQQISAPLSTLRQFLKKLKNERQRENNIQLREKKRPQTLPINDFRREKRTKAWLHLCS